MGLTRRKHCKIYAAVMLAISSQAMADETAQTAQIEQITITAEKMDKLIQDTTTAITVIDGDEIARGGSKTVLDTVTKAPNVVTSGFGTVNIRGINGAGAANGFYAIRSGARPRINTSVDGVEDAFTGYNFSGSGVWDIQKVEVLRGPQSTTQGENSIGGAIVVKTNDPTFDPEYAIRIGAETYKNGNVMKNAALMASGALSDELAYRVAIDGTDGQGYISYDGETSSVPVDPEDSRNINLRGKLLWKPAFNEDLELKLTANYRKADGNYLNWANWSEGADYEDETFTLSSANRTNTRIQDSDVNNISLEVKYAFNDQVSNITQISTNSQTNIFDQYPSEQTYTFKDATNKIESRLIITPADSSFNGFIGIMGADRENTVSSESFSTEGETKETRAALFGEANYFVTDKLTLTAGARLQYEKQDRTFSATYAATGIDDNLSDVFFLPKLAVTYTVLDNTTLGLSARQGYNSGGLGYYNYGGSSEVYTYETETVSTYEFSSKTILNNTTSINIALFYNEYQDFQGISNFKIVNVDETHTMGAELEAVHWLTDSLEIRPSIGFMKTEIDSDDDFEGNELSNAPELNIALGLTQFIGDNLSIGANLTYVGEYYSDLDNTEAYKAGDYTLADMNIDYTIDDLLISGYITNLTDEDVVYLINGAYRAAVGQSRTVGVNVTYRM